MKSKRIIFLIPLLFSFIAQGQNSRRLPSFLKMTDSSEIPFRGLEFEYHENVAWITGNKQYRRSIIPLYSIAYLNIRGTIIKKVRAVEAVADTVTYEQRKRITGLRIPVDNRVFARLIEDGEIKLYDFQLFPYDKADRNNHIKKRRSAIFWIDPRDSLLKQINYDSIRLAYPDFTIPAGYTEKSNQLKKKAKVFLYMSLASSCTGLITYLILGYSSPIPMIATGSMLGTMGIAVLFVTRLNGMDYELIKKYNAGR